MRNEIIVAKPWSNHLKPINKQFTHDLQDDAVWDTISEQLYQVCVHLEEAISGPL